MQTKFAKKYKKAHDGAFLLTDQDLIVQEEWNRPSLGLADVFLCCISYVLLIIIARSNNFYGFARFPAKIVEITINPPSELLTKVATFLVIISC
jgi:hypothetical protein